MLVRNQASAGRAAAPGGASALPGSWRGRRWQRLAARALTERAQTEHGLRLSFRPEPGAEEELRRLAAVENECCRWAEWTVQTRAGQIVLDAESGGGGDRVGRVRSGCPGRWCAPPATRNASCAALPQPPLPHHVRRCRANAIINCRLRITRYANSLMPGGRQGEARSESVDHGA
jgi:hypothetical protein